MHSASACTAAGPTRMCLGFRLAFLSAVPRHATAAAFFARAQCFCARQSLRHAVTSAMHRPAAADAGILAMRSSYSLQGHLLPGCTPRPLGAPHGHGQTSFNAPLGREHLHHHVGTARKHCTLVWLRLCLKWHCIDFVVQMDLMLSTSSHDLPFKHPMC